MKAFTLKSGSAPFCPDRQMFPGEKKAVFPFILRGLFDPEGQGAEAGLDKKRKRPAQRGTDCRAIELAWGFGAGVRNAA
ncbi:DNA helicase [Rossellomorea aquimaris]|uniref:DNA helicase n=1 Tax=Rossellomorea aquimaris TaxID=189382 RepID=A0A5D4U0T9_9BACI|nr:DNA helicase [Rossellomorea aquimaris]TYS80857.1 DNA helicase [Rossellomorea aquimaris]